MQTVLTEQRLESPCVGGGEDAELWETTRCEHPGRVREEVRVMVKRGAPENVHCSAARRELGPKSATIG
jgi:hypothetical protein